MVFIMTQEAFGSARSDDEGRCLACEAEAFGVEPDARKYKCEECGENKVYGMEELLIMGKIEIDEIED